MRREKRALCQTKKNNFCNMTIMLLRLSQCDQKYRFPARKRKVCAEYYIFLNKSKEPFNVILNVDAKVRVEILKNTYLTTYQ